MTLDRRALLALAAAWMAPATLDAAGHAARVAASPPGDDAPRLDRLDLLRYRDDRGVARVVATRAQWARRRTEILRGMQAVMGPLPPRDTRPLDVRYEDEVDCGTYVRRRVTYRTDEGPPTPAYLLVPRRALAGTRVPAVLCLHPTDHEIGHDVVVGLGGRANRAYAAELAERGFVTLAPSYPRLARYQPDVLALGYASGTMKAIHDNRRGLDLLTAQPFVDTRAGIGAIGHSLGGHNAVFTAAFDDRLRVVVSSCGLDLFTDYYGGDPRVWQPERGWCQVRYMPRLLAYAGRLETIPFDFAEVVAAIAPRVVFLSAPRRDTNFDWTSVDRIATAARPVFTLHGAAGALRVEHPDAAHDFPAGMRHLAYGLFERHLH